MSALTPAEVGVLKFALAACSAVLLLWSMALRRSGRATDFRRLRDGLLLALALFVYVPSSLVRGAVLLACGVLAYRFAQRARALHIAWLRRADTLAAQVFVLLALLSLPTLPSAGNFVAVPTVGSISAIPRELPQLALPQLSLVLSLLLPAISIAIIGLVQGAGVSQGTPNPDGRYPDVSRDFLGQGVANMATSLVGGIPAGGSVSGTALIMGAGARSRWGNIFVALFVALIVLLAGPLVERVPMPALAALLIVAGFQGMRVTQAVMAWKTGRVSRVVMLVTFLATLIVPLQFAVLFGVALSILLNTIRQSNKVVVTQWVLQPQGFPLEQPPPRRLSSHELMVLHVYGSLFFAAAKNIEDALPTVGDATQAVVAIVLRGKSEIGSTFVNVLQRYARALQAGRGKLMLVGVDPAVRDQLAKTGVLQAIGEDNVFVATPQLGEALNRAVAAADAWLGKNAEVPVGGQAQPMEEARR